jgi:alpha-D-xyloside xylohydrolase
VTILRPRRVDQVETSANSLTVFAPTAPLRRRGDSLNRPVITATFDAPAENVLGVGSEHFTGVADRSPHFMINRTGPTPSIATPSVFHLWR